MVYNREQIAKRAEAARTNTPGTCQLWTRTMAGGLSVGDFDRDGDADAVDGWKQSTHKHPGSKTPPRGTIVSFSGGSRGYGHRAISLGPISDKGPWLIRSTDMNDKGFYSRGQVGTATINQIEKAMGVKYLGWSEDISGVLIPLAPEKPAPAKTSRGTQVDAAIERLQNALKNAKKGSERYYLLRQALESLRAVDPIR